MQYSVLTNNIIYSYCDVQNIYVLINKKSNIYHLVQKGTNYNNKQQ
jgi:hypothetical protein